MSTVLIAYDGSDDAERALHAAHRLLGADCAIVATVWESSMASMPMITDPGMSGYGMADPAIDPRTEQVLDENADHRAHAVADQGVQAARAAGFARVHAVVALDATDVAHTLIGLAGEHHADVIAVGSRGHGGMMRRLMGSTSSALVKHSTLPVLVAPREGDAVHAG